MHLLPWTIAAWLLLGSGACARQKVAAPRAVTVPAPSESMRVYRDPATGAFVEPPATGPGAAAVTAPAVPTMPLTEEAAPGGGRMIRLDGAFRSHFTADVGPKGMTASCKSTVPTFGAAGPTSP